MFGSENTERYPYLPLISPGKLAGELTHADQGTICKLCQEYSLSGPEGKNIFKRIVEMVRAKCPGCDTPGE